MGCVNHLRNRFREGTERAKDLLDDQGRIIHDEVSVESDCKNSEHAPRRAKCGATEGLARALHGVQDFYAHSNWADEADPARPTGDDNPPGLNLPG